MQTSAPLLGEPLPVELMNTVWADRDGLHDALGATATTQAWLRAIAPRADLLTEEDLDALTAADTSHLAERLSRLRAALRRLAAQATGDPRTAASSPVRELDTAVTELNRTAAAVPRWPELVWEAGRAPSRLTRASGQATAAAVSALAQEAVDLFAGPDRLRLRACLAPGCVLYFAKHHSRREWCSTNCGNRARAARHYQRHRASRT
ncbi:CGNR zinc finger domain-containing protein [Nocardiopsis quinghaiensis]|uniref:CGNR zinc finger domain-containing protein n=1 Tax=Nocardiopsis quinghaiensis TaxID=464995 RepID=UPI0012388AAE|nr:CGNR zinc finger domain-containing protein [Nocardiopsis quinghaiensis]